MLSLPALEFPPPSLPSAELLEERRNSSAEKPMKKGLRKISRLLKSAYVRTFSARERILLFTRGGQKPALALPALQSPPDVRICGSPYYQLGVVYVPSVTEALSKNIPSETCFLPKSGGSIPTCRTYDF